MASWGILFREIFIYLINQNQFQSYLIPRYLIALCITYVSIWPGFLPLTPDRRGRFLRRPSIQPSNPCVCGFLPQSRTVLLFARFLPARRASRSLRNIISKFPHAAGRHRRRCLVASVYHHISLIDRPHLTPGVAARIKTPRKMWKMRNNFFSTSSWAGFLRGQQGTSLCRLLVLLAVSWWLK